MTDIVFDVSPGDSFVVTWTGASGDPGNISCVQTTSTTFSLISNPVVNVPGALPAGGVSYTYRIFSDVSNNGCSTEASFEGVINIVNGTASISTQYRKFSNR